MNLTDTEVLLIAQYGFPFVVAAVLYLYRQLIARLPEQKRATVERIVSQAVQAVEQAQSLVPGAVKKEYATNLVNSLLKAAGVSATPEQVDTLIEAAVYQFNVNRPRTQAIPTVK